MNTKYQLYGVLSGLVFFVLFFLACWPIAQFIPPPSPLQSGADLVAQYQDNIAMIRLGILLGLIAAMFLVPWSAVVALQIARTEGKVPFIAITSFGAGIANTVAFYLVFVIWAPAFYRLDRSPELIQLINDMAWLEFVMLFPPFAMQLVCIAIAGFRDTDQTGIFPRWFCYLSIWTALLIFPGGIAIFFKAGPFAWNGILALWTPLVVFSIYWVTMLVVLYKGIKAQAE